MWIVYFNCIWNKVDACIVFVIKFTNLPDVMLKWTVQKAGVYTVVKRRKQKIVRFKKKKHTLSRSSFQSVIVKNENVLQILDRNNGQHLFKRMNLKAHKILHLDKASIE